MTSVKRDWKTLFLEARRLIEEQVTRHGASCGCQDKDDPLVEGKCPGLQENEDFLERTKHLTQEGRQAQKR